MRRRFGTAQGVLVVTGGVAPAYALEIGLGRQAPLAEETLDVVGAEGPQGVVEQVVERAEQ